MAQQLDEQAGRTLAGLEEVDVRIGVINDDGVGVLQDAVGEDAVQVERGDNRHTLAQNFACFGKQVAFAILLVFGGQGAVQRVVDAVDGSGLPRSFEKLASQPHPIGLRDGAARSDAARAVAGHDLEVRMLSENAQGAADF